MAEWKSWPDRRGVSFHVEADRFLHHMVRMLVGTMVDVGLGRRPLDDVTALLAREDNQDTSPPAPPQGLYFVAATYPPELLVEASREAHAAAYPG
jgi:tRNA pseudouridine38-40 synthase